jgi:hypothetical protein
MFAAILRFLPDLVPFLIVVSTMEGPSNRIYPFGCCVELVSHKLVVVQVGSLLFFNTILFYSKKR